MIWAVVELARYAGRATAPVGGRPNHKSPFASGGGATEVNGIIAPAGGALAPYEITARRETRFEDRHRRAALEALAERVRCSMASPEFSRCEPRSSG